MKKRPRTVSAAGGWSDLHRRPLIPKDTCSIEGCEDSVVSRGWCKPHYDRWYRTGSPVLPTYDKVCEAPGRTGPNKGQPVTGTQAGYTRHKRAGEDPCDACAEGMRVRQREWRAANPAKAAAHSRRYRETHLEEVQARQQRWWRRNRAWSREYRKAWRAANPERAAAIQRSFRRRHPERHRLHEATRRARKVEALTISFTSQELDERLSMFGRRCYLRIQCDGVPADTIDHVIPLAAGGPHCLSNLRPACRSCNAAKNDRSLFELLEEVM